MRIGFFGGTFDPPHHGHLAVALAAAKAFDLDRVLLAPVGVQPLRLEGASASFGERLAMVKLLAKADPRLEASSLDAPSLSGEPNFTIDTLTRLKETLTPADSLFVIVGADAFAGLDRWKDPERLLSVADWIVVSRPGMDLLPTIERIVPTPLRAHVFALDGVAETVSATDLRERLSSQQSCGDLVPRPVLDYIAKHGLYRAKICGLS